MQWELLEEAKISRWIFFIFTCNNDIKIQEYRNNTLNSSSATSMLLMPVSIPPVFFSLFFSLLLSSLATREGCSDLELPFCQLWNKQLQFGSSFQRPLPFSFLSQQCALNIFEWNFQQNSQWYVHDFWASFLSAKLFIHHWPLPQTFLPLSYFIFCRLMITRNLVNGLVSAR